MNENSKYQMEIKEMEHCWNVKTGEILCAQRGRKVRLVWMPEK